MGLAEVFDDVNEEMMIRYMDLWASMVWQLAHEKGFHEAVYRPYEDITRDASPAERMMLIVSEVSEMLEAFRNSHKPGGFYFEVDGKPEGVASELADVVIRCMDYAMIYEINLGKVMMAKLRYNATRPYRHGGKEV